MNLLFFLLLLPRIPYKMVGLNHLQKTFHIFLQYSHGIHILTNVQQKQSKIKLQKVVLFWKNYRWFYPTSPESCKFLHFCCCSLLLLPEPAYSSFKKSWNISWHAKNCSKTSDGSSIAMIKTFASSCTSNLMHLKNRVQ